MQNVLYDELDSDFEILDLAKNKNRAKRRKTNVTKAIRKRNISRHVLGLNWYNNLHEYSKNKVHCSCNICRFRPTWKPDMKTIRDMKREDMMNQKLYEFIHEGDLNAAT